MCKKMLSLLLALLMVVGVAAAVSAAPAAPAEGKTLEERINALELHPQPVPDWSAVFPEWYDFSRAERIIASERTTYEKMQAIFLDIAQTTPVTSCTSHQQILIGAFEMLGLEVHPVWGMTRTKGGTVQTGPNRFPEGWTGHSWVAVAIDGVADVYPYGAYPETLAPGDVVLNQDVAVGGEVLYFDSNLYGTYGMRFEQCFAIAPRDAGWYQYASINAAY